MKWRLVTHPDMHASAAEIDERWSVGDVCEAHMALDKIDEIKEEQRRESS